LSLETEYWNAILDFCKLKKKRHFILFQLGKHAIQLYITEYFHMKYPLLHKNYLEEVVNIYSGISNLSTFGNEIGLNYVVRWNEVGSFYLMNFVKKLFLYLRMLY
jgi:hypothetical protein